MNRRALLAVPVVLLFAYFVWKPPAVSPGNLDFNSFYCGARILAAHGDPYRYEPLRSCEQRNLHSSVRGAVVPAPLPPYALAAFVPISTLSFDRATFLWWLAILLGVIAVIWVIVDLTALPMLLVGVCTLPMMVQTLGTGGLAGVTIALLCLAGWAITRGRYGLGSLLTALACIEPHVAAPAALALFLLVPKSRLWLVLAAIAALGVSAVAGLPLTHEYFAAVLPAHAFSEAGTYLQYSLTSLLYTAHVPFKTALALGTVQYLVFLAIGIALAASLRERLSGAAVVFVPIAFAVAGGTFIHTTEMAAALPLAMLIAGRAKSVLGWTAVALLAIPWEIVSSVTTPPTNFIGVHIAPGDLAEAAWRSLEVQVPFSSFWLASHLATYLGLALLYVRAITLVIAHAGAFANSERRSGRMI